jgi:type II secretion system protein N
MAFAAKNKKWLGYTLYVVLVTLVLLYYLFPAQAVEELIDNSIRRTNPAFAFKAEKIRPWVPAGLRISGGLIYLNDSPLPAVFNADSMYITVRILDLIRGKHSFDLDGTAYKGDISGWFDAKDEEGKTFESGLVFKDIELADYEFPADRFQHKITGKINGEIEYNDDSAGAAGENGKAHLRLNNGQLQFQAPLFGMNSVDLQNIDMELELKNRKITIGKAELAGSEVKAAMKGFIQLHSDIKLSRLNMTGTLEPLAEFYKNYPHIRELLKSMKKRVKRGQYFFSITGTLGAPIFKLQ